MNRDKVLLAGYALAIVGLTVPVVPGVWSSGVAWFGLPGSMLWVIGVMLWVFALLLWHFAADGGAADSLTPGTRDSERPTAEPGQEPG